MDSVTSEQVTPLRVHIHRNPFEDWVTLTLPDGMTENLDAEECREWFKIRGANMEIVEKATDYVWSGFPDAEVVISNPKNLRKTLTRKDPII